MKRISLTVPCVAVLLAGCWTAPSGDVAAPGQEAPAREDASYLRNSAIADQAGQETQDAVQGALVWSQKYSQAIEKLVVAQQENRDLQQKTRELAAQMVKLQAEHSQSQKELYDANLMLVELRQELEKWKKDVLGFRQEIRSSQEAQLEALSKVLRLLGGEVAQPTTQPSEGKAGAGKEVAGGADK